MPSGIIHVCLFAHFNQLAGVRHVDVEIGENAKVRDVLLELTRQMPKLYEAIHESLNSDNVENQAVVAINGVVSDMDTPVAAGDELRLLPPISGGRSG